METTRVKKEKSELQVTRNPETMEHVRKVLHPSRLEDIGHWHRKVYD